MRLGDESTHLLLPPATLGARFCLATPRALNCGSLLCIRLGQWWPFGRHAIDVNFGVKREEHPKAFKSAQESEV